MSSFEPVAVHALIGTPEMYDGQAVRVVGLCSFEFEGNAVWAAQEYRTQYISKNAVWLSIGMRDLVQHDGQVMLIEGIFSAQSNGHMGMFSGSIQQIARIEPWKG